MISSNVLKVHSSARRAGSNSGKKKRLRVLLRKHKRKIAERSRSARERASIHFLWTLPRSASLITIEMVSRMTNSKMKAAKAQAGVKSPAAAAATARVKRIDCQPRSEIPLLVPFGDQRCPHIPGDQALPDLSLHLEAESFSASGTANSPSYILLT